MSNRSGMRLLKASLLAVTVAVIGNWSTIDTAGAQDATEAAEKVTDTASGEPEARLTRAERRAQRRAGKEQAEAEAAAQSDETAASGIEGVAGGSGEAAGAGSADADGAVADSGDADAVAEPLDPFEQLLAERRRRDFPEFEETETGFTITEQIRIAPDVRANYQRALQLLEQGSLQQGIGLLRSVTENAPEVTAPHLDLGIAYGMTGELDLAEEALVKASRLSPDHPMVHNELGVVYRRAGRFAEARQSYEKALEVYPDFHFARRNLGVLCDLYLSDLDCALANYQAYLDGVLADEEVEIWVADIQNRLGQ